MTENTTMSQPETSSQVPPTPPSSSAATTGGTAGETADTPDRNDAAATPTSTVPPAAPKAKGGRARRGRKNAPRAASGAPPVAAAGNEKLTHLVIDSGAIIKGAGMTLASAAENFWTVPEVVAEIRDKKARHHLQALPFELKLREPSDEAMKFAANFARQTGDLRSLSRVDLRVIALTYMLERQETGASHLRTAPVRAGTKVNSKAKGVSAPSLEPSASKGPKDGESSGKIIPGTTAAQASTAAGDDAAPHAKAGKETAETVAAAPAAPAPAGTIEKESEMDGLCTAIKHASTDDVDVAHKEGDGDARLGGSHQEEGEENEDGEGESDSDSDSASDDENEEFGERGGEQGKEEDEESNGDEDEGDDEDWEPEGDSAAQGNPEEGATTTATTTNKPFSADDFPTLGGPAAQAVAAPPQAPADDAPASSWSLMARSNPAPFKVPAKADPAPLPAAEAPASTADPAAGHFSTSGGGGAAAAAAAAVNPRPRPDGAKVGTSRILSTAAAFGVSGGGGEDDDGEGWVNPSNIKSQKAAGIGLNGPSQSLTKARGGARGGAGVSAVSSQCRAGCVTTDFAMQNVILQVGLPLLSLDGMAVRRVKQWVLRCAACFKTTTEMGRLFCPVCGNASLDRVSCSVNAKTGVTYLHLRKNHKVNLRGSKFSIPGVNPAKGRFEGDLLLREDQLLSGIWAQKTRRKEKDVSSMFGEDITGNVGLTVSRSADIVVGYGRKNPNAARGRERRGKKSVKKRL